MMIRSSTLATLLLAAFLTGGCSGGDEHGHEHEAEAPAADSHDHGDGAHSHDEGEDHAAPQTEATYGDAAAEAEPATHDHGDGAHSHDEPEEDAEDEPADPPPHDHDG